MKSKRRHAADEATGRVAAYESLLDLYTLISFVLILAAFTFVSKSGIANESSSSVSARIAARDPGAPHTVPHDTLLIIIYRENSNDMLKIIDGLSGDTKDIEVKMDGIDNVLGGLSLALSRGCKISLAINDQKEDVNPGIVMAIQRWFAARNYEYHFYFTGK